MTLLIYFAVFLVMMAKDFEKKKAECAHACPASLINKFRNFYLLSDSFNYLDVYYANKDVIIL